MYHTNDTQSFTSSDIRAEFSHNLTCSKAFLKSRTRQYNHRRSHVNKERLLLFASEAEIKIVIISSLLDHSKSLRFKIDVDSLIN